MNISLPSLDIRSLVTEKEKAQTAIRQDFETNHVGFGENLAYHFATGLLNSIERNLKNDYFISPSETNPSQFYLYFSFPPENGDYNINAYISRPRIHQVTTFNDTLIECMKGLRSSGNLKIHCEGLMMRIALVAEKELKKLLTNYTSHPMHSMLKFAMELQKEDNLRLKIDYWIDLETQPLPPKKGFFVTEIKEDSQQLVSGWIDF